MKYLALLDGVDVGEISIGDMMPEVGAKVRLRCNGEPVDSFIHTIQYRFEAGEATLFCYRPETAMKGEFPGLPPAMKLPPYDAG